MAAKYVGINSQIARNNINSLLFLVGFPLIILGAVYVFLLFITPENYYESRIQAVNQQFVSVVPYVIIGVAIWFVIAFFFHNTMINAASGSKSLSRKENMRIYNLVENLCMSQGMKMPKVNIIEDPALNAFASGLNDKTYTVTLTRGIINSLNDDELEGVIAHELMHIRNRDVRLLIVSIIFVGILSFLVQMLFRNLLWGGMGRSRKNDGRIVIVALVIAAVAYFLTMLFRFGLSRKREYMADAGAANMTRKPWALASALRKISGNHNVASIQSEDMKEMCIYYKPDQSMGFASSLAGLFATHPPIKKRIDILEGF
jgi:heat shock protein HtpX